MKKAIQSVLVVLILIASIFAINIDEVAASNPLCPPQFHCALLTDVVSGKACPEGNDCFPVFPPPPDCPPLDVCFIMKAKSTVTTTASTTKGVFSSTAIFLSSLDRYSGSPGTLITVFGKNFPKSPTVSITSNISLPTSVQPTLVASSTDGSDMATFYLPPNLSAGSYSIALKDTAKSLVSNMLAFRVTALTSTQTDSKTDTNSGVTNPDTYTPPINTNDNTDTNTNTNTNNNYDTPTKIGKFALNEHIQTTDNLRVRNYPSLGGVLLTTQPKGTRGVIKGGPNIADGYTWWNIDYSVGADGWSAETYLVNDVTAGRSDSCFTFAKDLSLGSSGSDLFYLQTAFQAEGFQIVDSEKKPNPYFGNSTLAAAINYQKKYNITPQAGYVGPKTRANLNLTYGCR